MTATTGWLSIGLKKNYFSISGRAGMPLVWRVHRFLAPHWLSAVLWVKGKWQHVQGPQMRAVS